MQKYNINICGLSNPYMQKLSLYFRQRLRDRAAISIWNAVPPRETFCAVPDRERPVWLGSADAISGLQAYMQQEDKRQFRSCEEPILITLSDNRSLCRGSSIYIYQSCDSLYSDIFRICAEKEAESGVTVGTGTARFYTFLEADLCGAMLPYALTCARILNEKERTLFVSMDTCSGMRELLQIEHSSADLSDLFLALRRGEAAALTPYIGQVGGTDFLMPAENPGIFDELTAEDITCFLENLQKSGYGRIVAAQSGLHCWLRDLIRMSERVICLADGSTQSQCRKREIQSFFLRSGEEDEKWLEERVGAVPCAECGEHLVHEWMQGEPGKNIRAWGL